MPADAAFQPLFFYESSLDLLGGLVALFLLARLAGRLRHGDILAFWLIWYGLVRASLETLRLSYDFTFFGVPVAILPGPGSGGRGRGAAGAEPSAAPAASCRARARRGR